MEHTMREIVSNGDTFEFAKIVEEELYDLSSADSTAVEYNQIEMIKMLVGYGMDINSKSGALTLCNCPLHDAVGKGELTMVDVILELNGDIDAQNSLGLTPLAISTLKGHTKIALYLLQKGADPNIEDHEGKTAYIHAKENGNNELLQCLPIKKWSLNDDPKYQKLVEAKLKAKADGGASGKPKKGGKKGGKKKGKKKK